MEKEGITTTLFSHPNSIGQVTEDKDDTFDKNYYESTTDTKGRPKQKKRGSRQGMLTLFMVMALYTAPSP